MTPIEFDQAMSRLTLSFPQSSYSGERLKLIWEKCSWMTARSFERIVGNFIAGNRYAPLPKDFIDAAIKERQALGERKDMAPPTPIACHWCNDGGVCEVMRKADGEEFFCRCGCQTGRDSIQQQLPQWSSSMESEFLRHAMFGQRAQRWMPDKGFDSKRPEACLEFLRDKWREKAKRSAVMWAAREQDDGGAA